MWARPRAPPMPRTSDTVVDRATLFARNIGARSAAPQSTPFDWVEGENGSAVKLSPWSATLRLTASVVAEHFPPQRERRRDLVLYLGRRHAGVFRSVQPQAVLVPPEL